MLDRSHLVAPKCQIAIALVQQSARCCLFVYFLFPPAVGLPYNYWPSVAGLSTSSGSKLFEVAAAEVEAGCTAVTLVVPSCMCLAEPGACAWPLVDATAGCRGGFCRAAMNGVVDVPPLVPACAYDVDGIDCASVSAVLAYDDDEQAVAGGENGIVVDGIESRWRLAYDSCGLRASASSAISEISVWLDVLVFGWLAGGRDRDSLFGRCCCCCLSFCMDLSGMDMD